MFSISASACASGSTSTSRFAYGMPSESSVLPALSHTWHALVAYRTTGSRSLLVGVKRMVCVEFFSLVLDDDNDTDDGDNRGDDDDKSDGID